MTPLLVLLMVLVSRPLNSLMGSNVKLPSVRLQTFRPLPSQPNTFSVVGDINFQAQRRAWIQAASTAGVKTFGYLFTQPQPMSDPAIGGEP